MILRGPLQAGPSLMSSEPGISHLQGDAETVVGQLPVGQDRRAVGAAGDLDGVPPGAAPGGAPLAGGRAARVAVRGDGVPFRTPSQGAERGPGPSLFGIPKTYLTYNYFVVRFF